MPILRETSLSGAVELGTLSGDTYLQYYYFSEIDNVKQNCETQKNMLFKALDQFQALR